MKFAPKAVLRRSAEAPAAAAGAPVAPQPPRGRPVVAFAGILDGRSLWLAIHAAPGSLALRVTGTGDVVALPSDVPDDDPAFRAVRVDLGALPGGAEPTSYDVVLVPAGGGTPKPVWSHPLPTDSLVRTPLSADGTHAWSLERGEDGGLRAVRTPQPATVALRAVAQDGEAVTLAIDPLPGDLPGHHGPELRLVDQEGVLVHTLPLTIGNDGLLHARISLADLPTGDEVWPRVLVDEHAVRRRGDDLAKAQAATMLPQLFGEDPETPELRLRWTPEGTLGLRIAARPAHPAATSQGEDA
ncbi:hypothetical protein NPS01_14020 [Nocardioides psychrotolerans]|uniref:Uncharacterized protein n=1 Tax=Nocardioides psychrotolerans TaxID=1005945 RepID=A0A1I3H5Z3_9ACTN|nr:hypothetical protein [Nocardioides psychrotolerans]GEP37739.1 hypothetical protein NPS01_14020 [Nocardioides psychrotolerans]SFI30990.1 hypothetical protein SAMN05216561_10743 [Nocardioides psychrotolerans]